MGCCNKPLLKRVENVAEGVSFKYKNGRIFTIHRDDIISFSSSSDELSISVVTGYTMEISREELTNFDEVIERLK